MVRLEVAEALGLLEEHDCTECNLSWLRDFESEEAAFVSRRLDNLSHEKDISVNLTRTQITVPAIRVFAELALNNKMLVDLNLEGTQLGDLVMPGSTPLQVLQGATGLRSLNLAQNRLGSSPALRCVAELIAHCECLRSVGLDYNKLKPHDIETICEALQGRSCSLEELFLSGNPLDDDGAAIVAAALPHTALTKLYLEGCGIGNRGASSLATQLAGHGLTIKSQLHTLNLSENRIGNNGATSLAKLFGAGSTALKDLSLSSNPVGRRGILSLGQAIQSSTTLRSLDLGGIGGLSQEELDVLTQGATANYMLVSLELHEHYHKVQQVIDSSIERNRELAFLLPPYSRLAFACSLNERLGRQTSLLTLPRRFDFGGDLHDRIISFLHQLDANNAALARFGQERYKIE